MKKYKLHNKNRLTGQDYEKDYNEILENQKVLNSRLDERLKFIRKHFNQEILDSVEIDFDSMTTIYGGELTDLEFIGKIYDPIRIKINIIKHLEYLNCEREAKQLLLWV